jgi:hypothetical protein
MLAAVVAVIVAVDWAALPGNDGPGRFFEWLGRRGRICRVGVLGSEQRSQRWHAAVRRLG